MAALRDARAHAAPAVPARERGGSGRLGSGARRRRSGDARRSWTASPSSWCSPRIPPRPSGARCSPSSGASASRSTPFTAPMSSPRARGAGGASSAARSPRSGSPAARGPPVPPSPTRCARAFTSWRTSFWEALPRLYRDLEDALSRALLRARRAAALAHAGLLDRRRPRRQSRRHRRRHRGDAAAAPRARAGAAPPVAAGSRAPPLAQRAPGAAPGRARGLAGAPGGPCPRTPAYLEARYADEPYRLTLVPARRRPEAAARDDMTARLLGGGPRTPRASAPP